jgi:creatinine amidohydrolase
VTSYALDEIPWSEVAERLEHDARLIFPVGALEQHGPHLPLGANIVIAERVAHEVSSRLGILRAPTFSYGVIVAGGPYPGRAGLRRKTLHRAVNELFAAWEDQGVAEFVIITAHRFEPHLEPLLMALTSRATKSVYDLYEIGVSDLLETDPESEHAGELETSLMLHLRPELVRDDVLEDFMPEAGALRRYTRRRVPKAPKGSTGVVGYPTLASAEKGARIFDRYVEMLASTLGSWDRLRSTS